MKIIVNVDTQVDYCITGKKMYVDGALEAVNKAENLINNAVRYRHLILSSVDTYDHDYWGFKANNKKGPDGNFGQLPLHCVKGSNGWLLTNETSVRKTIFVPNLTIREPELERFLEKFKAPDTEAIIFEKEDGTLFDNPMAYQTILTKLNYLDLGKTEQVEFYVFGMGNAVMETAQRLGEYATNKGRLENSQIFLVEDGIAGCSCKSSGFKRISVKNAANSLVR